jgi:hypothetical protein
VLPLKTAVEAAVKVSWPLLRCQRRVEVEAVVEVLRRPRGRGVQGCCRGVEAAVEVSRPPSRCLSLLLRCDAAVEVFESSVEV